VLHKRERRQPSPLQEPEGTAPQQRSIGQSSTCDRTYGGSSGSDSLSFSDSSELRHLGRLRDKLLLCLNFGLENGGRKSLNCRLYHRNRLSLRNELLLSLSGCDGDCDRLSLDLDAAHNVEATYHGFGQYLRLDHLLNFSLNDLLGFSLDGGPAGSGIVKRSARLHIVLNSAFKSASLCNDTH
jgi:hypothetical protein